MAKNKTQSPEKRAALNIHHGNRSLESCLVSHKAFQINNKHLAKGEHAQVCELRPRPQSRQPIVLSLFSSL